MCFDVRDEDAPEHWGRFADETAQSSAFRRDKRFNRLS